MKKDSLGDRMKSYESQNKAYLMRKVPVIIRIDGKAFHSFTQGMEKPFDAILYRTFIETARGLCKNIQGVKFAYGQSDEISLLLTDTERDTTDAWFGYSVQKMVSVAASIATLHFNESFRDVDIGEKYVHKYDTALFDARVFSVPENEVVNYFIWRQQDATRNSIQMLAQANFSPKKLDRKNTSELNELLWAIGINYNEIPTIYKRGYSIIKESFNFTNTDGECYSRSVWRVDSDIPIFTKNRDYIERTFKEKK